MIKVCAPLCAPPPLAKSWIPNWDRKRFLNILKRVFDLNKALSSKIGNINSSNCGNKIGNINSNNCGTGREKDKFKEYTHYINTCHIYLIQIGPNSGGKNALDIFLFFCFKRNNHF